MEPFITVSSSSICGNPQNAVPCLLQGAKLLLVRFMHRMPWAEQLSPRIGCDWREDLHPASVAPLAPILAIPHP